MNSAFFLSELPVVILAQDAAAAADAAPKGFFQILFSGGTSGIIIIMLLLLLSVYSAYLIVDHFLTIRRTDLMPEGLADTVRQCLITSDIRGAQQACQEKPSFLSFVLMHGIAELEFGWNAVEKSVEDALAEQSARLFRKICLLYTSPSPRDRG